MKISCITSLLLSMLMTASAVKSGKKNLIYTMTNSDDPMRGNEILALHHFVEDPEHPVTVFGRFPTGGVGSNSPIGSQFSMITHNDRLLAVNTWSNDISVFDMDLASGGSLDLVHVEPSQGQFPVGLAAYDDIVYVLNTWDQGSIVGYKLNDADGVLTPIYNSKRILNAYPWDEPRFGINTQFGNPGLTAHESPSQVGFTPDGKYLIVFNKGSDHSPHHEGNILTYEVDHDTGLTSVEPVHNVSTSGNIRPFSFTWTKRDGKDVMLRTEADGVSSSSYAYNPEDGSLTPLTEHVSNGGRIGLCWNANHEEYGVMYGTNAPNSSISSYHIMEDGSLELFESQAFQFGPLAFPFDVAVEGNYLYTIQAGSGSMATFQVEPDGTLSLLRESFIMNPSAPAFDPNGGLLGLRGGTGGGIITVPLASPEDMGSPCALVARNNGDLLLEALPLTYIGNDGNPSSGFPLAECQGDCDHDDDCTGDLVCFQRSNSEPVPGCDGNDNGGRDFCIRPALMPPRKNLRRN